jgi:S1-C subfamily serine protease
VWETDAQRSIVVTNFHVVRDASEVTATFRGDPTEYPAKVLGFDDDKDVAVLEVRPGGGRRLRPVPLGRSSALRVGQKVFAIGNPFGLDHTLTTGIVSGVGREIESAATGRPIAGVIQTDAAINPGNSGGPLLDSRGRLIGVNTVIYSPSGASSGVGFAIPSDTVRRVVNQIIRSGRVVRAGVGVHCAADQIARRMNVDGVIVLEVPPGSGAAAAGIRGVSRDPGTGQVVLGDVVVAVEGHRVSAVEDLLAKVEEHDVGEVVRVTVRRGKGGGEVDLKVRLTELKSRM